MSLKGAGDWLGPHGNGDGGMVETVMVPSNIFASSSCVFELLYLLPDV
jgi:hypothetical protein